MSAPNTDMDRFRRELEGLEAGARAAGASQSEAQARDLAGLLVAFRRSLVEGGFPSERADDMAQEWFSRMLDPERQPGEDLEDLED